MVTLRPNQKVVYDYLKNNKAKLSTLTRAKLCDDLGYHSQGAINNILYHLRDLKLITFSNKTCSIQLCND